MNLTKAQSKIAKDTHRFRVVNCGRRFGKTTLAVEEIKGKAVFTKEAKIAYIAPTYQQARDIAWAMLKDSLRGAILNVNESRLEIDIPNKFGGKSTIYLRGWESVETLRGQRFDFLVIDEIASMRNFWLNWQEVLRPTLTDTKGDALFISTPKGFNHFYDLFNLEHTDSDYKSFHFTSYDNPHLPVEELEKAKEQVTEDRFAQEYLADFRKTEGLVYKEFDRTKHLYTSADIKVVEKIAAVDFGYTNPACVLRIDKDDDANYWVRWEWYKTGQTNEQIIEAIKRIEPNVVYADPEAPDKINDLRKAGFNLRDVVKGKDSVRHGIDKVREMLKSGRLHINVKCKNLIWEFETYAYPEKQPDKNAYEKPIKENDHALDALRYALMTNLPYNKVEIALPIIE